MNEPRAVMLQLPWPTSINAYWKTTSFGSVYVSAEGKAYKETVSAHVRRLCEAALVGRISLDAKFYPPNRQRRDLDNCLKVMIDAIQASGIISNDFQIKKLSAEMFEPIPNGGAIVELCEIPEPFTLF